MNKLTIIGNLTKDPELRTTTTGVNVCSFTLAVNRKKPAGGFPEGAPQVDYFRVTAWRERGETCAKFLQKGKKACVIGPVSVSTYTAHDGTNRAQLEVTADEVEFLSPRISDGPTPEQPRVDQQTGYEQVDEFDDLPF